MTAKTWLFSLSETEEMNGGENEPSIIEYWGTFLTTCSVLKDRIFGKVGTASGSRDPRKTSIHINSPRMVRMATITRQFVNASSDVCRYGKIFWPAVNKARQNAPAKVLC